MIGSVRVNLFQGLCIERLHITEILNIDGMMVDSRNYFIAKGVIVCELEIVCFFGKIKYI